MSHKLYKTKDDIRFFLTENIAQITFTKVDGDTRIMRCTLDPSKIAEDKRPIGGAQVKQDNVNVLRVFDLDKNDWRSFRVNSVTDIQVV